MEQHFTLTRVMLSTDDEPIASTSISMSDADAINCAHMLAAGFNTMNRNMLGDFVLAVVDKKAGVVQYDGKIEKLDRPDPHTVSTSFKFEASTDPDTMVTIFDNENGRLMFPGKLKGKLKFAEESKYAHVNRDVLEDAYAELQAVKEVLADAGVETIPADRGVEDLRHVLRARDAEISELVQALANRAVEVEELRKRDKFERFARSSMERKHFEQNEAARVELIEYVKRAHRKKATLEFAGNELRGDLADRLRGMLDVLARFLVVTGECEDDERHAVARRLCGIDDE